MKIMSVLFSERHNNSTGKSNISWAHGYIICYMLICTFCRCFICVMRVCYVYLFLNTYIIHQQFDITLHHLPQHSWINLCSNGFKFRHMVCPWKKIVFLLHRGRCQTDQFTIVSHTLFCSFVPMVGVF